MRQAFDIRFDGKTYLLDVEWSGNLTVYADDTGLLMSTENLNPLCPDNATIMWTEF